MLGSDISSADDAANALCLLQAGAACRVLAGDISAAAELLTDCDELSRYAYSVIALFIYSIWISDTFVARYALYEMLTQCCCCSVHS